MIDNQVSTGRAVACRGIPGWPAASKVSAVGFGGGAEAPGARVASTGEGVAAAIGGLSCRKWQKTPNCGKIAGTYLAGNG